MEEEWEREKEKILNSLLGSGQDVLELPSQNEVRCALPSSPPPYVLVYVFVCNV